MTEVRDLMKKMCVIGEASVGKTSLIRRFVVDKFDDKYIVTIGTKTSKKILNFKDGDTSVNLKLIIWDILGQRSFPKLKESAFKGSNGAFIVLDLSRRETLYAFEGWLSSLYKVVGEIPVIVLANKNDLKGEFGKEEIDMLVKDYGFPYYLTSAKTGKNVNDAFYTLGRMMLKPSKEKKIGPVLEKSRAFKMEIDKEIDPDRRFTILEVEDIIMTRYCELLEDPEYAMAIIRAQFKRADLDFRNPSIEGLKQVVDFLISAAADQVESSRLDKEGIVYANLIRRIG
ncbi:MAG: GTP-binding protein [Thermoplasmata archaeon]|nr:MAG: GTP-binding protein [Thermoplasmata archaeon]